MMNHTNILIVGAGQAAGQLLITLKQNKFSGKITLIGDEEWYPYQRPPLSKLFLSGELEHSRLFIKQANFYNDLDITFRFNTRVKKIDTHNKIIDLNDIELNYEQLILATGTRPRKLSIDGSNLKNIFYLRDISDAENIKSVIKNKKSIVIIGAGYIGLEVAATAVKSGLSVTVIEKQDRVMNRVVSKQVSGFFESEHKSHGVNFIFNDDIVSFSGGKKINEVNLLSGKTIKTDAVLVGIGGIPNTEITDKTKIVSDNGIKVDNQCRTNVKDVYAIGDCTNHWNTLYNRYIRLESVQNAIDQAKVVASNLTNIKTSYNEVPWFWSDQFDLKLQIAGISEGYDKTIIRTKEKQKSFSCLYLKDDVLIAVDSINDPKDFIQSKKLIMNKVKLDLEKSKDVNAELKDMS